MSDEGDGLHSGLPATPLTPVQRRRNWLYLLPLVLLPVLLLCVGYVVVPTRWFALHSGNRYLANLGYGATLHGADCQVVIYGDSSAAVGLDPLQIERQTGLKTCNIAEFEGMMLVNGTEVVDRYLRNNPRPRFLVFLYAPDDLNVTKSWATSSSFEAITYRMRYRRDLSTAWLLLRHPNDAFAYAEQGMRMAIDRLRTPPFSPAESIARNVTRGQFRVTGTPQTNCGQRDRTLIVPDPALIRQLKMQYGVDGTEVIVDAMPMMSCDPNLAEMTARTEGRVDNAPYRPLPMRDFIAEGHLHVNTEGSAVLSAMVADQIRERMQAQPASGGR